MIRIPPGSELPRCHRCRIHTDLPAPIMTELRHGVLRRRWSGTGFQCSTSVCTWEQLYGAYGPHSSFVVGDRIRVLLLMEWIWQQPGWPRFSWDQARLAPLEARFLHESGRRVGAWRHLPETRSGGTAYRVAERRGARHVGDRGRVPRPRLGAVFDPPALRLERRAAARLTRRSRGGGDDGRAVSHLRRTARPRDPVGVARDADA